MSQIVIVAYDPSWPAEFAHESARVTAALAPLALATEHIGSTAIPGMSAKPIVDIMIGVGRLADVRQKVDALAALGYTYVQAFEAQIPERMFFQRGSPRTHHVHVVETGGAFWRRQVVFRDYLKAHPELAQEYADLKRGLAARFPDDREGYTQAKTDFVQAVLARAGSS